MSKQKLDRNFKDEKTTPVQNVTVNSDNGAKNNTRHNVDV